jgi:hypothetical protein
MLNFTEIRLVWAELFHADSRTDMDDEANIRFSQFRQAPSNVSSQVRFIFCQVYFKFKIVLLWRLCVYLCCVGLVTKLRSDFKLQVNGIAVG